MREKRRRNQTGSGIIEGTVGLMLVLGGSVLGALLVLNSGAGIFFKVKEAYVTELAAQYALSHTGDQVTAYVQSLMPQVGLSPSNLQVTTNPSATFTPAGGQPQSGASVTVSNLFPLFGNGSVFPLKIQLSDTEFATTNTGGMVGFCNVYICNGGARGIVGEPFNQPSPGDLFIPIYKIDGPAPGGLPLKGQTINLTGGS